MLVYNFDHITDEQVENMRAILIDRGHNGGFASPHPVNYWEAEEIIEVFYESYPNEFPKPCEHCGR